MPEWIEALKQNIKQEFGERPAVVTLATVCIVNDQPCADARTVLVRRVLDDGTLLITSDARSEKNAQLRANRSAAVVFWFPCLRKQCIIEGVARILSATDSDPLRTQAWRDTSNASRAMFDWPASGQPRDDRKVFSKSTDADAPIPDSFEVLLIDPALVDTLDLNPDPQLRMKWIRYPKEWASASVNP